MEKIVSGLMIVIAAVLVFKLFSLPVRLLFRILLSTAAGFVLLRYRRLCVRDFGGLSGDLAGWFLQTAELWMLAALTLRHYVEAIL